MRGKLVPSADHLEPHDNTALCRPIREGNTNFSGLRFSLSVHGSTFSRAGLRRAQGGVSSLISKEPTPGDNAQREYSCWPTFSSTIRPSLASAAGESGRAPSYRFVCVALRRRHSWTGEDDTLPRVPSLSACYAREQFLQGQTPAAHRRFARSLLPNPRDLTPFDMLEPAA